MFYCGCLELWSSSFPMTTKWRTSLNGQTLYNRPLFSGSRDKPDSKALKFVPMVHTWFDLQSNQTLTWTYLWKKCLQPQPGKHQRQRSPTPPWCWAVAQRCGIRWVEGTPTHHLAKTEETELNQTKFYGLFVVYPVTVICSHTGRCLKSHIVLL